MSCNPNPAPAEPLTWSMAGSASMQSLSNAVSRKTLAVPSEACAWPLRALPTRDPTKINTQQLACRLPKEALPESSRFIVSTISVSDMVPSSTMPHAWIGLGKRVRNCGLFAIRARAGGLFAIRVRAGGLFAIRARAGGLVAIRVRAGGSARPRARARARVSTPG